MKPTLTNVQTLMGAKSYAEEIQAEHEIAELDTEELEDVAGGVCVGLLY